MVEKLHFLLNLANFDTKFGWKQLFIAYKWSQNQPKFGSFCPFLLLLLRPPSFQPTYSYYSYDSGGKIQAVLLIIFSLFFFLSPQVIWMPHFFPRRLVSCFSTTGTVSFGSGGGGGGGSNGSVKMLKMKLKERVLMTMLGFVIAMCTILVMETQDLVPTSRYLINNLAFWVYLA